MMLRNFDIFEKFPDESITWRACAFGQFEAERKLQELAEHSENEFLAVDILTGEPRPMAGSKKLEAPKKVATR
jgi:hypothetical protein